MRRLAYHVCIIILCLLSFLYASKHIVHAATLHISGNKILMADGQPIQIHGVGRSGTDYACVQNQGVFDGASDGASIQAIKSWHINAVRLGLNEDCWLGINGAPAAYSGTNYQNAIKQFVTLLNQNGIIADIDLHWSAPGTTLAKGQAPMADKDHSLAFWTSVATTFKDNPLVIFEAFNEPYPDNASNSTAAWQCWLNGGTCSGISFQAAGMQEIITTIRATGATNLILLGGVNYAGHITEMMQYLPNDPLHNIAAAWHQYRLAGISPCVTATCLDPKIGNIMTQLPVVATEFGETDCQADFLNAVMNYFDSKQQGYFAWKWTVGKCQDISLINDYAGTPSTVYGQAYKTHLAAFTGVTATPSVSITPTISTSTGQTSVFITVCPHGLGNCGDNVGTGVGNTIPKHPIRTTTITFYDSANKQVGSAQGTVAYSSASKNFQGTIPVNNLSTGLYLVKVRIDGFLSQKIPGIPTITQNQLNSFPILSLTSGDVNSDNQINILDYNMIISCFGSKIASAACITPPDPQTSGSDINDDGKIDGIDYNILLRELSVQKGE
ncbi:MAG TPA: cellulase family glycosylhydrolase [Candidatus Saccharimonadales bacterium]|nr:cellulase family glycosylhydrolase [Candidatus Saccharimonadales bacterium]